MISKVVLFSLLSSADAAGDSFVGMAQHLKKMSDGADTCGDLKTEYKKSSCCGSPMSKASKQLVPSASSMLKGSPNVCDGKKALTVPGFNNKACFVDGAVDALEQSGTNITAGYYGLLETEAAPITSSYFAAGLCPVNVHWHLGTEHYSVGQFDEMGKGPSGYLHADEHRRLNARHDYKKESKAGRRLADVARIGFRCHYYDESDARFTTEYDWQYCQDMHVGETYEVHWPHSKIGDCGTTNQYQTPFYDGVFCHFNLVLDGTVDLAAAGGTNGAIGVQGQIFQLINDESYYYPNLISGMIVDGDFGKDMVKYTGSTTGTSRDNVICSVYTPITWQVDRKCHLISASSFDKMCADMMAMKDDMTDDLYPHGARELVADELAADNFVHPRRMRV